MEVPVGSGEAPLPSTRTKPAHAHWDCSMGANGSSILEACLDVWQNVQQPHGDGNGSANSAEDSYMDVLRPVLRALLPSLDIADTVSLERNSEQRQGIQWSLDDNIGNAPDLTIANARNAFAQSDLPDDITEKALRVVSHMEQARSKTNHHQAAKEETAEDEIYFSLCVACTLWLWNQLPVQSISLSPFPCHGASLETLQLLIGMPTNPTRDGALITPTAVALLKVLSADYNLIESPPITLQAVGMGPLGSVKSVRLLLGTPILLKDKSSDLPDEQSPPLWKTDRLIHMEANLDDISAEALAFAVEVLLKNGAVDAWVAAIVMKKGRAAHTLHCICRQGEPKEKVWESLLHLIFQHTTTLGVRIHRDVERAALHRKFVSVQTPYSKTRQINVKVGYLGSGKVVSVKAEFDHCRDISLESGIPLQQIAACAVKEAFTKMDGREGSVGNA